MTYSVLGSDPETGEVGVAVQSRFPNVRALVPYAEAGAGAIATQAFGDPRHAQRGLQLLRNGATPADVAAILTRDDETIGKRQFGIVDESGRTATFTGDEVKGWHGWAGGYNGKNAVAQGNGLAGEGVVRALVEGVETGKGMLADRLISALEAGQEAGGELRGQQSTALLVVRAGGGYGGNDDRVVDLSVVDHEQPIAELARLYGLHRLSFFPSDPDKLVPIEGELAEELKTLMRDRGFYSGSIDRHWEADAIEAMQLFMGWENYDNRIRGDALIDSEVLADMRAKRR